MHAIFLLSFHLPPVQSEVKMEPYMLFLGERLVLPCLGHEEAQQEVRWTKQGAPLASGDRMLLRAGQLEIEAVVQADSGLYSCFILGPLANHSAFFHVNVTGTCHTCGCRYVSMTPVELSP